MLERFKLLLKLQEKEGKRRKIIRHLAITMHGMENWSEEKKAQIQDTYKKSFTILNEVIQLQIKNNIPILTIYILPEQLKKEDQFPSFLDELIAFLNSIKRSSLLHENKIKISALGKWYDVPGRAVDARHSAYPSHPLFVERIWFDLMTFSDAEHILMRPH